MAVKKTSLVKLKLSKRIRKLLYLVALGCCLMLLLQIIIIPVRLAIATHQAPEPQGILTLGGGSGREEFTVKFAQAHPSLDVWISSGRVNPAFPQWKDFFQDIGMQRVHLSWHAADTVGDFAYHVKEFQSRHIQHIYLITSDYHMPRAKAIATLILGSRGIAFTPVSIPSNEPPEPQLWLRIFRDSVRSVIWMVTGSPTNGFTRIFKSK